MRSKHIERVRVLEEGEQRCALRKQPTSSINPSCAGAGRFVTVVEGVAAEQGADRVRQLVMHMYIERRRQ